MIEDIDVLEEIRRTLHLTDDEEKSAPAPKAKSKSRARKGFARPLLDQVYDVRVITAGDLIQLDGKCSDALQKQIDIVKSELDIQRNHHPLLSPAESRAVARIARSARKNRSLGGYNHQVSGATSCSCCGKSPGYKPYMRNGSNGAVKGKPNRDKPLSMRTMQIARQYLCMDCWGVIGPALDKEIAGEEIAINRNVFDREPEYVIYETVRCRGCSWEGFQHELRLVPDKHDAERTHFGGCPGCDKTSDRYIGYTFPAQRQQPRALVRMSDMQIVQTLKGLG